MGGSGRLWASSKAGEGQTVEGLPTRDAGLDSGLGYICCSLCPVHLEIKSPLSLGSEKGHD